MSKTPKYSGRRERSSAAQSQEFISAKSESGPTASGNMKAPLGHKPEDNFVQAEEQKRNAPSLPSELRTKKINWLNIFGLIASVATILGILGGVIFWFANLNSKVDATASNILDIKPKVGQLLITSKEHDIRLDNLEKNTNFERMKINK